MLLQEAARKTASPKSHAFSDTGKASTCSGFTLRKGSGGKHPIPQPETPKRSGWLLPRHGIHHHKPELQKKGFCCPRAPLVPGAPAPALPAAPGMQDTSLPLWHPHAQAPGPLSHAGAAKTFTCLTPGQGRGDRSTKERGDCEVEGMLVSPATRISSSVTTDVMLRW